MKIKFENPVTYLWRKMYAYAGERKKYVFLTSFMFFCATGAEALRPVVFAYFLNAIQVRGISGATLPHLFSLLLLFLMCELVFWAFWGPARIIEQKTAFLVRKNYKEHLLKGVMALPLSWHVDHHSGDTIDKIEKGTTALFSFSEYTFEFLKAFITLVIAIGALLYFNVLAASVVIIAAIFIFYIMIIYDRRLVPGYKILNKFENTISEKVYDVISNITTVIILRIEHVVFGSIRTAIQAPFPQFRQTALDNEYKWFWAATLGQFSVVLAIAIYLFSVVHSGAIILIGSVYVVYSYAAKVRETFFSFAQLYNRALRYRAGVANAELLSSDFTGDALLPNRYLPKQWEKISIQDLSFSYSIDNTNLHLESISLNFKRGEKIAIIGESGGGKTTFLKLLRGLYAPNHIKLSINDKEVSGDFNLISDSISLIPQDPEIFSATIRENITLGVEYTHTDIEKCIDMASFTEVVARLPRGLESNIVEKGVNLSGGEKQRLALARGLLASRDKDIILLDEPTSSVDFHNELKIYQNIFTSFQDKTVISSVHRLHLLSLFDTIFFFKSGQIVAQGNLAELKESSTDFQDLWDKYLKTQNS